MNDIVLSKLADNIRQIQGDVARHLTDVNDLLTQAESLATREDLRAKYRATRDDLKATESQVRRLELRMSVVAPMKAGKSTLINAIVGKDLLPSRETAMTAVPTEVVLDDTETGIRLDTDPGTIKVLMSATRRIRDDLRRKPAVMKRIQATHAPLATLIADVLAGNVILSEETRGHEAVRTQLETINDIVRLAHLVSKRSDLLEQLEDVPRITVKPGRLLNASLDKGSIGRLVITDTPGPNESGQESSYAPVIQQQLNRSGAILVVLDFTGLNNSAAADIKQSVRPVVKLIGHDRLYAVVNKVDQRQGDAMDEEKVRAYVKEDLDFAAMSDAHIFETTARWAFAAGRVLEEMEQSPDVDPKDLVSASVLLQNMYSPESRWRRQLASSTKETLTEDARELWAESGLEAILSTVIDALRLNAGPLCLRGALNRTKQVLAGLHDELSVAAKALDTDVKMVTKERDSLRDDVRSLNATSERVRATEDIRAKLRERITRHIKKTEKVAREALRADDEPQDDSLLGTATKPLRQLWARVTGDDLDEIGGKEEFEDELEAIEFTERVLSGARNELNAILDQARVDVSGDIASECDRITAEIEQRATPIVEAARTRLSTAFDVTLSLEPPSFNWRVPDEASQDSFTTVTRTSTVTETIMVRRRTWKTLWIAKSWVPQEVQRDIERDVYIVSLPELSEQLCDAVISELERIRKSVLDWFDKDFRNSFDSYFGALEDYLRTFEQTLTEAIDAQAAEADGLLQRKVALADLIEKVAKQGERAKRLMVSLHDVAPTAEGM